MNALKDLRLPIFYTDILLLFVISGAFAWWVLYVIFSGMASLYWYAPVVAPATGFVFGFVLFMALFFFYQRHLNNKPSLLAFRISYVLLGFIIAFAYGWATTGGNPCGSLAERWIRMRSPVTDAEHLTSSLLAGALGGALPNTLLLLLPGIVPSGLKKIILMIISEVLIAVLISLILLFAELTAE